jgi:hypothetical protein
VNELFSKQEPALEPEVDRVSLHDRIARLPRRSLIGAGVFVLVLIWLTGTNGPGLLLGLGVLFAVFGVFLWQSHRASMQSVRRDLGPPEKP